LFCIYNRGIFNLRETPYHHDQPYYPVDGEKCVSLWIPLDPIKKEENSVRYVAGSHRWQKWFIPRKFETLANYDYNPASLDSTDWKEKDYTTITEEFIKNGLENEWEVLSWDMEPGDLIAFNFRTLHGAPGNPTSSRRRVVALRFTGDDARITTKRPWQVSPPMLGGLAHGKPLDSATFPVIINE